MPTCSFEWFRLDTGLYLKVLSCLLFGTLYWHVVAWISWSNVFIHCYHFTLEVSDCLVWFHMFLVCSNVPVVVFVFVMDLFICFHCLLLGALLSRWPGCVELERSIFGLFRTIVIVRLEDDRTHACPLGGNRFVFPRYESYNFGGTWSWTGCHLLYQGGSYGIVLHLYVLWNTHRAAEMTATADICFSTS